MADVFISYSKTDRAIAEDLANNLNDRGFDVWWDFEIYAGDDFHDLIRAKIAAAKAVVVIWSDPAVASTWVRGEAKEAGNKLISTHVPGFDPDQAPINFVSLHCEPVTNCDRIVAAIQRKFAASPAPSPVDLLRAKAEARDSDAMYALGLMYAEGRDVAKDPTEAARYFRLAASRGHEGAQYHLGVAHEMGLGVPKDDVEAARLYRRAAAQRHAGAQCNLGRLHADGRGVAKDDAEAVRHYRLAADQENANAQTLLGLSYELGRGVEKNVAEAVRLYLLAAKQGEPAAKVALKWLGVWPLQDPEPRT